MLTLGEYIRESREKNDFSLREFAKRIECSAAFLSDIELNRRNPSDSLFSRIAKELNVSEKELSKFDTRPPTENMRTMSQKDPKYAFAFRSIMESGLTADEMIHIAKKKTQK
jgi:transcriptional regulator with XRE-family HTH domain